jgi:lipopolysaccharide transport system permease protein
MYASPVVYGLELIPEKWRGWFALNPMATLIEGFRQALLGAGSVTLPSIFFAAVVAGVILVSGAFFFRRMEREFADDL